MTTTESKKRTITLTNRAPVTIREDQWPVIAVAKDHDGQVEAQANRKWILRVRQHEDGRALVYGVYDSHWQDESGLRAGELLEPGADIAAAINRVAADCDCERIAADCIADLPAQEI